MKKFNGSVADLEDLLVSMFSKVTIDKNKPKVSLQAKTESGTVINFFAATRTIQFQNIQPYDESILHLLYDN